MGIDMTILDGNVKVYELQARKIWGLFRDAGMDIMPLAKGEQSVTHSNTVLWDMVEMLDHPVRQEEFIAKLVAMRIGTREECTTWVDTLFVDLRRWAEKGYGFRIGI
jgi:hypothetical protein